MMKMKKNAAFVEDRQRKGKYSYLTAEVFITIRRTCGLSLRLSTLVGEIFSILANAPVLLALSTKIV
jgi:hypothetical protein